MRQEPESDALVAPQLLVEQIQAGEKQAESELVRRYSRAIMVMLENRTGDVQRAEDVHQETFCIVLQRLRTTGIKDPSRIAAFLHKTALNVLIGEYRKESRRQTHTDTDLISRHRDEQPDLLRQLIRSEADDTVRTTIHELTNERDKELLYRFYILQQEKPLICKALELTPQHFDRVISRARRRFRDEIRKKLDRAAMDDG